MLCSMVIKILSMCFHIFLPSFRRVWFSSDDFAQSYRLLKRVTNMNPGHVKGVHDVNEVAIFWLMNFAFRCIHLLLSLITLCNNVSSLSSTRGSLINFNVFSATFGFDPRPVSSRIKSSLSSNLLHHLKQVHD